MGGRADPQLRAEASPTGAGGRSPGQDPAASIERAVPSAPSFPLVDLPRDALGTALELLSVADLLRVAGASRSLLVFANEVQRRPCLVSAVGPPDKVLSSMPRRLLGTPTLGFLFAAGDLEDAALDNLGRSMARWLPPGCHVVGSETQEVQALVQGGDAASPGPGATSASGEARSAEGPRTQLQAVRARGHISLMLGCFPDAVARSFHVSAQLCMELSQLPSDAAAVARLADAGLPVGEEWKTVVLLVCGTRRLNPDRLVRAFQKGCPSRAVIGGIASGRQLMHARGHFRAVEGGVVGLALKGDVPLTALVSRGCLPLTAPFRARGARLVDVQVEDEEDDEEERPADEEAETERVLLVPELVAEDGSSILPIHVAMQAQQKIGPRGFTFTGVRPGGGEGAGFLLEQLAPHLFRQGGTLQLPVGDHFSAGPGPQDCEVRFYVLDAEACKEDLTQLLGWLRQVCEQRQEQTLGAVMFTCGGRGRQFFGQSHTDALHFQAAFPNLPLTGFWAGGEIGPQALADAGPAQAIRTGSAALQGFTAVFGVFRAPVPKPRSWMASLPDEDVPAAVGALLGKLALEAESRGEEALKDGEAREARQHFDRAASLAAVPTVDLPTEVRATLMARSISQTIMGVQDASSQGAVVQ